jgi:peptide/nickel transport system substrate-binding protein
MLVGLTGIASAAVKADENTLVVSLGNDEILGLDPSTDMGSDSTFIAGQIYDTLAIFPPGSTELQPSLATSWSVSEDGLTWTFNIRSGVKFHDGTDLNASAVAFNFNRWWDQENPYHLTDPHGFFAEIFGYKGPDSLVTGIESSLDGSQFILHLKNSYNILPYVLANPVFSIASEAAIKTGTLSSHPVGTGPFIFQSWDKTASLITLAANANYWGHVPYLSTLKFQSYSTPDAQFAAIKSGAAQVAYGLSDAYVDQVKQDINLHYTWRTDPNLGYMGINRDHGPLANPKVRQAMAHAIDKQSILKNYYGPSDKVADQILPEELWGYNSTITDYTYDPALAKTLLAEAGYPNGISGLTLEYRNVYRMYMDKPGDVAKAIQTYLAAVGIQIDVQEMDPEELLTRVRNGDPDLFLLGWGADTPHPDNFINALLCGDSFTKSFGTFDAGFCPGLQTTLNERDYATQKAAYEQTSRMVHDELPMIPLANGHTLIIIRSEVAGLERSAFGGEAFEDVFYATGANEIIKPTKDATLVVEGSQAPTTTIDVPAGAVTEKVVLAYAQNETVSADLLFRTLQPAVTPSAPVLLDKAFDLSTYKGNVLQTNTLLFNKPMTLTVDYSRYLNTIDLDSLALKIWNGSQWASVSATCQPDEQPVVDQAQRQFSVKICQSGTYGLFAVREYPLFLPLVRH